MILILGVTGSGKGRLAFELACEIGAEIISVDSMKVYRRMDIGTAKPPKQALQSVRHHLIDVVEPSEPFNVGAFLDLAYSAIEEVKGRGKPIITVGGTALYIKALLYGLFEGPGCDERIRTRLRELEKSEGAGRLYSRLREVDPSAAERIHANDSKRIIRALEVYELTGRRISQLQKQFEAEKPRHEWMIIGLRSEKEQANRRINQRVKRILSEGLVDEAESLLAEERPLSRQAGCAIGYGEIIDYLHGNTTLEEAVEQIKKNTRRLAKNQRTWFKTFKNVNWLDVGPEASAVEILDRVIRTFEVM